LATDGALCEVLRIAPEEWAFLRSLRPPGILTKDAYVAMLYLLRSSLSST
jgi:hypothetical protein